MRAEEALPDHQNATSIDGVVIRKGTIAAFLANARIYADPAASADAHGVAERDILESLPALHAIGLFEVMMVRDDAVRALVNGRPMATEAAR